MIAHDPSRSKKADILNVLTQMLAVPRMARVTTANLARELNQSEAALYRHFSSKAQMFESLIGLVRHQLQEDLEHIEHTEPDGRLRLRKQAHALLLFAERHQGLARVLTGEALAHEDASLLIHLAELHAELRHALHQNIVLATSQGTLTDRPDSNVRTDVLMDWLLGRWLRYSQSGWIMPPTESHTLALDCLGL